MEAGGQGEKVGGLSLQQDNGPSASFQLALFSHEGSGSKKWSSLDATLPSNGGAVQQTGKEQNGVSTVTVVQ